MQLHPYFNLRIHTDEELGLLVGAPVIERETLQEWPLSCVQKLLLADGPYLVYKSAWGPGVEAEFYACANSPLLVKARTVYAQDRYSCLLIDWVEAPRLEELQMEPDSLLQASVVLQAEFHQLPGNLPCYLDLRQAGWGEVMNQVLQPLDSLCQDGRFQQVTAREIARVRHWCEDQSILAELAKEPGLVHGDLTGDNVFLMGDGYKVIDWQRPIYGPQALDLVDLLESGGIQPGSQVEPAILRLRRLLSIHWLVQCALRWFPEGAPTYDRQVVQLVEKLEAGV